MYLISSTVVRPSAARAAITRAAPTVSVTLHKMEESGYIVRHCDENDQRQMLVYLTETGKQIEKRAHEKATETEALSLDGFSEKEQAALKAYLLRIYQNLGGNDNPIVNFGQETECDKH